MEKIVFKTKELSPDTEVKVAIGVAISKELTGKGSNFTVEMEKDKEIKDVEVPVSCVTGVFDLVRPHLHSLLDEWLDEYEYSQEKNKSARPKQEEEKRDDDGNPFAWKPRGV